MNTDEPVRLQLLLITPPPIMERSIEMTDEHVCLSVCLSVCEHISRTTCPIFTTFFAFYLCTAVVRFSSGGVAIRNALPVLWLAPCLHITYILEVTQQRQMDLIRQRIRTDPPRGSIEPRPLDCHCGYLDSIAHTITYTFYIYCRLAFCMSPHPESTYRHTPG